MPRDNESYRYRSLTNKELVRAAEARVAELEQHGIPFGALWAEVLARLDQKAQGNRI